MEEKKARKPNWTEDEKVILLEEYRKRKTILKSKFDPTITANKKQRNWKEITAKINARSTVKRSVPEIQKKLENLTVMAKKEMSCFRRESNGTGGGSAPKPISSDAVMVADIIGRDSPTVKGIAGGQESGVILERYKENKLKGELQTFRLKPTIEKRKTQGTQ
ncbi:hypothetical protein AALO_G00125460 [Alosa alosa]|uniref:Myb/SANT-like DNA-binding domain-containing protein n=1 Tax=Alosa alosa TaxID=278164 RepID=A0AAV6GQP8_9TELE|nr:hypothetical protein AALO_G00125460 [Alosa alosa]